MVCQFVFFGRLYFLFKMRWQVLSYSNYRNRIFLQQSYHRLVRYINHGHDRGRRWSNNNALAQQGTVLFILMLFKGDPEHEVFVFSQPPSAWGLHVVILIYIKPTNPSIKQHQAFSWPCSWKPRCLKRLPLPSFPSWPFYWLRTGRNALPVDVTRF